MSSINFTNNPEKIAFVTDSCADIKGDILENIPVFILPLKILCGDKEYYDGVDIFAQDVYNHLKSGVLPKTSLPNYSTVKKIFDEIAEKGFEKVIAVQLSSALSGTYQLIKMCAEERDDLEIKVFDSLSGSLGMGITVLQAYEDMCGGMKWDELVNSRIPYLIKNTYPFFSVDTLEYLQKGGRIGKITAMAGTMLQIKPIISFTQDGVLSSVSKVRGKKHVQDKLIEFIEENAKGHKKYNLAAIHGAAEEEFKELVNELKARFPHYNNFWTGEFDATLSVYLGDGALGAGIQILD